MCLKSNIFILQLHLSNSLMFTSFYAFRARAFQKLLPGRFESDEESSLFLTNLSKSSKFLKFLKRLFPWHPRPETQGFKILTLILAARTDTAGFLQFGTLVPLRSGQCNAGPNPWIRQLLQQDDDAVTSMLMRLITHIFEFARPGRRVMDMEWADKIHHRSGKFDGVIVILTDARPGELSHEVFARVRMRITPDPGAQVLARDVDLYLDFETYTELGAVSGDQTKFTDSEAIECSRFPANSSVVIYQNPEVHLETSPPSRSGQSSPIMVATPMIRLNAWSAPCADEDSTRKVRCIP